MDRKIVNYLKNYTYQETNINRILVSAFLYTNEIYNVKNKLIKQLLVIPEDDDYAHLMEFISFYNAPISIEHLLQIFEFVISPEDKEVNGAVFTPIHIREFIVDNVVRSSQINKFNIQNLKIGDIACGCGGFFITISKLLKLTTDKSFYDIFKDQIYGLDIQEYSVTRTKILLSLFAIANDEDVEEFKFNMFCGNALSFDWKDIESIKLNGGFDLIVGNPPYVGASKIDKESRLLLKKWTVTTSGKSDLYIPFFEIGLENLTENGILGYITVNTFYKSLNGRAVRSYFSKNRYDFTIIDFGGEQLFTGRSTYTCICIISKTNSNKIKYAKTVSGQINSLKKADYIELLYEDLNDYDGWFLVKRDVIKNIKKIEAIGKPLGKKFEIRNGFATLKNNIYVFSSIAEDNDYYFLLKNNVEYKIEKGICRDAIKPNTLKSETEIERQIEKLIFPYNVLSTENLFKNRNQSLKIISELDLKSHFPFTYQYLLDHKEVLGNRDNGNRTYEEWYAYGRNQALLIYGHKLLLPYISSEPCFVYTDNQELLFYNGYAIISDSPEELLLAQKILMSKVFWYYIEKTSKPYSGNYYSVAKNYIKNFGLCDLTQNEKAHLLQLTDINEINNFLIEKYQIQI